MKKFNKVVKVLLVLALCCGMLVTAMPAMNASAAKMTNKKAHTILNKQIKNKFCKYLFIDLDKDKIDEMIVLGFSGKFVDGDDKLKTLDVYKVSGKKAKSIYHYDIDGDFYHPTLEFNLYYNKAYYMTVSHEHEGYAYYYTYKYTKGKFKIVAGLEDAIAENEQVYYVNGKENVSKKAYDKFLKPILANEVDFELEAPATKVANKYLKKMLKAEFERVYKYEDVTATPSFSDEDGDGIDELIAKENAKGGRIFFVYFPGSKSANYGVGYTDYKIVDGAVVYEKPNYFGDDEGDEGWGPVDGEEYCGTWQCDRCSIEVVREGESAFVFDIKWGSSASETDEWNYFAFYQGEDEDGNPYFKSEEQGFHLRRTTDDSGEEKTETIGSGESSEFVIKNGKMYWHNLSENSLIYGELEFVKIK